VGLEQRGLLAVELGLLGRRRRDVPQRFEHPVVLDLRVDQHPGDIVVVVVANHPLGQAQVLMDQSGGLAATVPRAELPPEGLEHLDVLGDLALLAPVGLGADDDPLPSRAVLVADLLEPRALLFVLDLLRDADVVGADGQQHDPAAGQRDTGGHPGALIADRRFGELEHQLLLGLHQVLDRGYAATPMAASAAPTSASTTASALAALATLALLLDTRIRGVQESVALEADIDEGRVHAWQHGFDHALVDAADLAGLTLDFDLHDLAVFE